MRIRYLFRVINEFYTFKISKNNIKIVAHSPLAKGEKLNDVNLINMAAKYNVTPAKLMLLWGHKNNYRIIPNISNVVYDLLNLLDYCNPYLHIKSLR